MWIYSSEKCIRISISIATNTHFILKSLSREKYRKFLFCVVYIAYLLHLPIAWNVWAFRNFRKQHWIRIVRHVDSTIDYNSLSYLLWWVDGFLFGYLGIMFLSVFRFFSIDIECKWSQNSYTQLFTNHHTEFSAFDIVGSKSTNFPFVVLLFLFF